MSRIYAVLIALILLAAGSCNIINPSEPVPTYVHIDSFSFSGSPARGTNSHNIKVAYVYLNNQSIGIFDLPVTFPVIMDKPGTILVTPGVYQNGLTGYPVQYPFYRSDTFTLSPNPGQVIRHTPVTSYFDFTTVPLNIDFEGGTGTQPFVLLTGDTAVQRNATPGEVFEGNYSGIISLTGDKDSSESITSSDVVLSPNTEIYLELDYKCTVPFVLGMYTTVGGISRYAYLVGFYPTDKWTKAYVQLQSFVSTYQGDGKKYKLLLKAARTGSAEGQVLIDNLKIVSP